MKEIYIDKTSPGEDFRHALFPDGSTILKNAQKNHTNLFEYPVYFCAICIIIFVTGNVDAYFVKLAYWYFYLIHYIFDSHIYHFFLLYFQQGSF